MRDLARVLYLTPGCFDKGGISRYNRYQIRALRDLLGRDRVEVHSVLGPNEDAFEEPIEVRYAAGGVRKRNKLGFVTETVRVAAAIRPQIVVSAHVNLGGLGHTLARATRATSVLNVYGSEVWSGLRVDSKWAMRQSRFMISDCHFTAGYIREHGLRPDGPIDVVWDCVDLDRFFPSAPSPDVLQRYGIPAPGTGVTLLTLGRMSPDASHKGYDRLLNAFARIAARVPELRLVYAGRGALTESLKARAAALGVADRVFFTGMVREQDMADVYRSADIFSLVSDRGPGRGEGIPLTPLEAAACGVPLLVGNHDGSQEAIFGGENGFVLDPFDLAEHARVIELLATDSNLRRSLAQGALAVARAEFSYEGFRRKHEKLLSKWLRAGAR